MADTKTSGQSREGGWGYVIVPSVFLWYFLYSGYYQTQTFFFVEWQREFSTSSAEASVLVSVGSIVFGISCPIGGVLATVFGNRAVVMTGGSITALGMFCTMMMDSTAGIIWTWGVMIGFGFALAFTPSVVMIGQYFSEHFTIANGVAFAGGSIGQICLPLIVGYLIDNYGWRGTMWILSAIMCHLLVSGTVLRPNEATKLPRKSTSTDGVIAQDNHGYENELTKCQSTLVTITMPTGKHEAKELPGENKDHDRINVHENSDYEILDTEYQSKMVPSAITEPSKESPTQISNECVNRVDHRKQYRESSGFEPFKRKCTDNQELQLAPSMQGSENDIEEIENEKGISKVDRQDATHNTLNSELGPSVCQPSLFSRLMVSLKSLKSIFRIVTFDIVLVIFFIFGITFYTPVAHSIPRALETGMSRSNADFLPTLFGIGNFIGRLVPPFIVDLLHIRRDIVVTGAFAVCALANLLSTFFTYYWHHVAFNIIYGCATGTQVVFLFTIVQVILPTERRGVGVGLATFVAATAEGVGALGTGWMVDSTGSYTVPFWFCSGLSAIGAILTGLITLLNKQKGNRDSKV